MTRAQAFVGHLVGLGEGELDACRGDALALDDDGEIVESRTGEEDGLEQAGGKFGVHRRAALDRAGDGDGAFDDDDRRRSAAEVLAGFADLVDDEGDLFG